MSDSPSDFLVEILRVLGVDVVTDKDLVDGVLRPGSALIGSVAQAPVPIIVELTSGALRVVTPAPAQADRVGNQYPRLIRTVAVILG